jgi:hypothetical protein
MLIIGSQIALRFSFLRAGRSLNISPLISGTHFCWRLNNRQGLERLEGLSKLKNYNDLIDTRTRDIPACKLVRLNQLRCRVI